jgi:hypothetical protein
MSESPKQEEKKPKYKDGPWIRIEADALTSKTAGRVDLGSYWVPSEVDSGVLARRIAALEAQGYQNITTRRIEKEPE